jgi:hypothetical protein
MVAGSSIFEGCFSTHPYNYGRKTVLFSLICLVFILTNLRGSATRADSRGIGIRTMGRTLINLIRLTTVISL